MTLLADWVGKVNSAGSFESAHQPQEAVSWTDVSASRASGVVYQNTSGKKMRVSMRLAGADTGILDYDVVVGPTSTPAVTVGGSQINVNSTAGKKHKVPTYFEVPVAWYYKVTIATGTVESWIEMFE